MDCSNRPHYKVPTPTHDARATNPQKLPDEALRARITRIGWYKLLRGEDVGEPSQRTHWYQWPAMQRSDEGTSENNNRLRMSGNLGC